MCIHTHVHTHSENMYYWNGIWKRSQIWVVSRYLFLSKMSIRCLVCKTLISHQMILHVWSSSKHPCLYSVHAKWLLDKTSHPRERGAWCAAICGAAQSQTRLKRLTSSSSSSYQGPFGVEQLSKGHFGQNQIWPGIRDLLVWNRYLRVILDRTRYDQISGTFWYGVVIFGLFWTGPSMTRYQGPFGV